MRRRLTPRLALIAVLAALAPAEARAQEKSPRLDRHGVPLPPGAVARLGTLSWQQKTGVTAVAFSPDGNTLAAGSGPADGRIYLRDAATGRVLRKLQGHTAEVHSLRYSPDGLLLASGSDDRTTRLWDVKTGNQVYRFPGDGRALAFSPDGRLLAATALKVRAFDEGGRDRKARSDGTIRLWIVATGKEARRIECRLSTVTSLAFSTDGKTLASAHTNDPFAPERERTDQEGRRDPGPAAAVRLWEVASGRLRGTLGGERSASSVAFLPDGKTLLVGDRERAIRLWDIATGRQTRRLFAGGRGEYAENAFRQLGGGVVLALSADGRTLISACQDHTVLVWDWPTGKRLRQLEDCGFAPSLSLTADGRRLAVAGHRGTHTVRIWETATGDAVHRRAGHAGLVTSLAFAPDGKTLVSVSDDVCVWDLATATVRRRLPGWGVVAYSPDGKLLATGSNDQTLRLRAAASGREIRRIRAAQAGIMYPLAVAFSPDGKLLATETGDFFTLWDVDTGKESGRISPEERNEACGYLRGQMNSAAFSPDGRTLAWAAEHSELALWQLPPGQRHRKLPQGGVKSVAFSPDGKYLASAGGSPLPGKRECSLHLWDVATGESVCKFEGAGGVRVVAFAPDGKTLAGARKDGDVLLWDVATGRLRQRYEGHTGAVRALAFSPDGRMVASGGMDATILIWAVPAASGK